MPVNDQVMALGDWSLKFKPDTPKSIRDAVVPFGHIVITPGLVAVDRVPDAAVLAAARYTGVVTHPGPQFEISGMGLNYWLGDNDPKGPLISTAITASTTIGSWMPLLKPAALSAGSYSGPAGTFSTTFNWITNRQAIETVCNYFGAEYRVTPDFKLNSGTVAQLYGSTPTAIAVSNGEISDGPYIGIQANMTPAIDFESYTTEVFCFGRAGRGLSGGASSVYYDPQGNLMRVTKMIESPDAPAGTESTVGTNYLNTVNSTRGRQGLSISSDRYDITGDVKVGAYLYVFDQALGLVDTANKVPFRGRIIYPQIVRVMAARWPVVQGMGVYHRLKAASSVTYTDLTPYIEYESPGATLDVATARSLTGTPQASSTSMTQILAGAWDQYTPSWSTTGTAPSLGNGTLVGIFRREGTTLFIRGQLAIGTTTTTGTGLFRVSLPSGCTAIGGMEQTINATIVRPAVTRKSARGVIGGGSTLIDSFMSADDVYAAATVPFTWASGDLLNWNGAIEIQP